MHWCKKEFRSVTIFIQRKTIIRFTFCSRPLNMFRKNIKMIVYFCSDYVLDEVSTKKKFVILFIPYIIILLIILVIIFHFQAESIIYIWFSYQKSPKTLLEERISLSTKLFFARNHKPQHELLRRFKPQNISGVKINKRVQFFHLSTLP